MINGAPTDSNSKPYKDGAHDIFDQSGAEIVEEFDTPDWSPDEAQREMEQTITNLGADGFDAVYSANDGMATGVIAAMKASNIDPTAVPVTGQDGELSAVQRILAGEQLMTVYQPISDIAESSAELAVPLAPGRGAAGRPRLGAGGQRRQGGAVGAARDDRDHGRERRRARSMTAFWT